MKYLVKYGFSDPAPFDDLMAAIQWALRYTRSAIITTAARESGPWTGPRRPVAHAEIGKVTARCGWAWPTEDERRLIEASAVPART